MLEKFHWTSPGGTEVVLPRSDQIKAGVLRKVRHLDEIDAMFAIFEAVVDEDMLACIDDLTLEELNLMAEAWQSGAPLGESAGSSTSSTPTEEPSSTTSAPASPVSTVV